MTDISTGSTATCRYCGNEIVYQPWFLDGRDPNPPVWAHVKSGVKSCSTRPVGWEADRWPFATPAAQHPTEAATVRDAARQTTGQDNTAPDPTTTIEPQDHPGADLYARLRKAGEDHDTAQALIYAHARMVVREHTAIYGDAPAVGQPAEAHDTDKAECTCVNPPYEGAGLLLHASYCHLVLATEARPSSERWRVEGYDANEWNPLGLAEDDYDTAVAKHTSWKRRLPETPTRLVRETTTWTVEDER